MKRLAMTLALLGSLTAVMAAEATVSVEAQIEAIEKAPQQERVRLMNQLKEQLATMSPEERQKVMQELHLRVQNQTGEMDGEGDKLQTRTRTREQTRDQLEEQSEDMEMKMEQHRERIQEQTREHAEEMQMEAHEEMERQQEMSQREAGEQFRHEQEVEHEIRDINTPIEMDLD